ncbi:MAG: tRNA lysidine(34) synthetase TilS [Mariprofundales bacterium]|nr:tRNA lysidine(34) synthetase TilS [Mariprofundales bacterium]
MRGVCSCAVILAITMVDNRAATAIAAIHRVERPTLPGADEWLDEHTDLINWQQPLAVAISGGADSTALLLALAARHRNVEAWHIDHGWHPQSAEQAQQLREQCTEWGITCRTQRVVCSRDKNRESSARSARMGAFAHLSREHNITQLALAHHRDDQAETVLMRMLHGDGVQGCCGIAPRQRRGELQLIRPLLAISHSEIVQQLAQAGVSWFNDPSNQDLTLMRNRLRLHLLPAMTKTLAAHPTKTDATSLMLRWQHQAAVVAERVAQLAERTTISRERDGVHTAWSVWAAQPAPVRAWTLQKMVKLLQGEERCMGRRHIELAEIWLKQGGHNGIDLSRCRLQHRANQLWLLESGNCANNQMV